MAVHEHINQVLRALYETAETPRTAFGDSGRVLSGVALETELRPIVQRTLRKRAWWTRALRRRSVLVLALARQFGVGRLGSGIEDHRVRVLWPPMLPKDDVTEVQNQVRLVTAGLRSHRSAMDALGIKESVLQRAITDALLITYKTRLLEPLAADAANNFHLAHTQGTLVPASPDDLESGGDWADEIHPSARGWKKLARRIGAALDALLDDDS